MSLDSKITHQPTLRSLNFFEPLHECRSRVSGMSLLTSCVAGRWVLWKSVLICSSDFCSWCCLLPAHGGIAMMFYRLLDITAHPRRWGEGLSARKYYILQAPSWRKGKARAGEADLRLSGVCGTPWSAGTSQAHMRQLGRSPERLCKKSPGLLAGRSGIL